MKAKDRIKFQNDLISELMEWKFESLGYKADRKEFRIYNEYFKFPFYAETTRGTYFTFRPSLRIHSTELIKEINAITKYQMLTNGIFDFNERLNEFSNVTSINQNYSDTEVKDFHGQYYYVKIYDHTNLEHIVNWFKTYISQVIFPIINKMATKAEIYNFLRNVFLNQIEFEKNKSQQEIVLSNQISLNHYSIITMIYLGYLIKDKDIDELSKKAKLYKESPLYSEPIIELIKHFETEKEK